MPTRLRLPLTQVVQPPTTTRHRWDSARFGRSSSMPEGHPVRVSGQHIPPPPPPPPPPTTSPPPRRARCCASLDLTQRVCASHADELRQEAAHRFDFYRRLCADG